MEPFSNHDPRKQFSKMLWAEKALNFCVCRTRSPITTTQTSPIHKASTKNFLMDLTMLYLYP